MRKITFIASINVDVVATTAVIPNMGETVTGDTLNIVPGGKGFNQGVVANYLGQSINLIGCIGNDNFGEFIIDSIKTKGISSECLKVVENTNTGAAVIVSYKGDNKIIVIPGANYRCDVNYIKTLEEAILQSDIVVMQLEVPLETVKYVTDLCKCNNIKTILNPAPAIKLPEDIIEKVDYLTPNEHEYKIIFDTQESKEEILKKYPNKLIITEGENGVWFSDKGKVLNVKPMKMDVVDTTGAGDTFTGSLSYYMSKGLDLVESISKAVVCSALAVTQFGAQGFTEIEAIEEKVQNYIKDLEIKEFAI